MQNNILDSEQIKIEFINILIKLTKDIKINSFQIENDEGGKEIIDYKNIKEYFGILEKRKLFLSKKYIKLFEKEEIKDYIIHNCHEDDITKYKHKIIMNNDNIYYFNIMNHAKIQFVKRYILFMNEYYNEVKIFKNKDINKVIIKLGGRIKYNDYLSIIESKELEDIMIDFIKESLPLNENRMGRHRDKRKFKSRDEIYNQTSRFLSHPFLFIFDNVEKKLVTTELYSSSFNTKILNDKIKHLNNSEFDKIVISVKKEFNL